MKSLSPALLFIALLAAACGQRGPLYLPDEPPGEVVTRPGPGPTTPEPPVPDEPEEEQPEASPP